MKKIQVGMIGAGSMARFHAEVLQHLGVRIKAVAATPQSLKVGPFAEHFKVETILGSWQELLFKVPCDALWITASYAQIPAILAGCLATGLPIFVEKPAAIATVTLEELCSHPNAELVQVGYNRRFYRFIPSLRQDLKTRRLRSISVKIPETFVEGRYASARELMVANSTHVLDLLLHLVGPVTLEHGIFSKQPHKELIDTYSLMGRTSLETGATAVNIQANWGSAENFSLSFYLDDEVIELKPIEMMRTYRSFRIEEPTSEVPLRRYTPELIAETFAEPSGVPFKPGFLLQAETFIAKYFHDRVDGLFHAATLQDSLKCTRLVDDIFRLAQFS